MGEVLSRLTTDTTLVQAISGVNLSIILRSSLTWSASLVLLAVTSAKLMGVILVLIPVVVVPLIIIGRRVRGLSRASQDRIADTSGLAGETLNAIQTVQAFTLEELQSERYGQAVEDSFVTAVRRTRVRAVLTAVGIVLVFAAITFVLWLGAHQVLAGTMTGGQLAQFLVYAGFVGSSAAALSEMWGEMQRAAGAMERLERSCSRHGPAICAPAQPAGTAAARARRHSLRQREFPLSVAARDRGARQFQPGGERPARPSPSSVRRARARARRSSCCCDSTIRTRAGC